MQKKYYTVKLNGKLFTDVVDDMNTTESWAIGGIIFLKKKYAKEYIENMKRYEEGHGDWEIIELLI
jgi:hypothetical protein